MTKRKQFREWMQEDADSGWEDRSETASYKRKDGKRYDRKKSKIQNARKRKAREKHSFFDG